jgi:putative DNA primase/helicase
MTVTLADVSPGDKSLAAFSDDALALRFTDAYGEELRYVAPWDRWYRWTGVRWQEDNTLLYRDLARDLCRDIAAKANDGGKAIASRRTVEAIPFLAKADRRIAATIEQWDADKWLLNTPDGVIDLRDGDKRSHDPEDYITKCAAVSPGGSCALWLAFLDRIMDGDKELVSFIQRMLGYALTGLTRDHAMFFLHGTGANGKSVLISTVAGILNEYHRAAPMEMLLASKHDRHPTELAGLVGARLVTAAETDHGRRWDEAKIKQLTGGDRIAARLMHRDFFEYAPQFKIIVASNHKPQIRSVDEAMRRRLNLIPFSVTIPPAERDTELAARLKLEWPAILQWMVEGCVSWQDRGLDPPEKVKAATADYLASQDVVAQFIAECLIEDRAAQPIGSARLFAAWKEWAEASGEYVGTNKTLTQRLEDKGFERRMKDGRTVFYGWREADRKTAENRQ